MTFRELLNITFNTGTIFKVMQHIHEHYYIHENCSVDHVSTKYIQASQEMMELPGLPGCTGYQIKLTRESDPGDKESYVDVQLYDPKKQEVFSVAYIDWADLIDLEIVSDDKLGLLEQLSHILYELTFYGFTRESIAEARADLYAAIDEAKNTPDNMITWDQLKQEFGNQ